MASFGIIAAKIFNPMTLQGEHVSSYLGDLLLERGLVSSDDVTRAQSVQLNLGGRLDNILMRLGSVSEDNLLPVLAEAYAAPLLQAKDLPATPEEYMVVVDASGLGLDWWLDQELVGWREEDGVHCAGREVCSQMVSEMLSKYLPEEEIHWHVLSTYDLERTLDVLSGQMAAEGSDWDDIDHLRELAEEAPVIEFVNNMLAQAFDQRGSDIHIEPGEHQMEIRVRVDGVLYNRYTLPSERFNAISSRVKLISGMDIAERRLPQDGRFTARLSGKEIDLRVSSVPGVHGESLVMRLLPKESETIALDRIGIADDNIATIKQHIHQPHGIILVTGPTGSGKSTTLYSILDHVSDAAKKIITVEDPVEYRLEGITQLQTHAEIGYTFASALRSVLRQDPDVLMVGEIRDLETAEIAIQASLTGHLVLSTLHTNDAVSAFTRLIDMGVEPFLVATPVRMVVAQRLVRKLCQHCAKPAEPVEEIKDIVAEFAGAGGEWREAVGCDQCFGHGYHGRTGIHEVVEVTPEMQHLILSGAPTQEMMQLALSQGTRTLRGDGLFKASRGVTSVDEVLRVTAADS
jgi:general secretion pathway protein E